MSLFRFVKYSSILFFLGRHKSKLFRSLSVLLFALITSLLYEDLRVFLADQHPGTLIYALVAKVVIVYGSLAFVLWQFRPRSSGADKGAARAATLAADSRGSSGAAHRPKDRLDALRDLEHHERLRSRYDRVLSGERRSDSIKSSRS